MSEWKEWNGGEKLPEQIKRYEYFIRGSDKEYGPHWGMDLDWSHDGSEFDIVKYREFDIRGTSSS